MLNEVITERYSIYNNSWENVIKDLKDESVDLIYTDPPYEMNYRSNIPGSKEWCKNENSKNKFDKPMLNDIKGSLDWDKFLLECYRVLKPNKYLFMHANVPFLLRMGQVFEKYGLIYKGTIIWSKKFAVGGDLEGAMKRDWEPILYLSKGKKAKLNPVSVLRNGKLEIKNRISEIQDWVFLFKECEKLGHPTQKPIELSKQIIQLGSKETEVVLDPFAGSGTCLQACTDLNRKNISVELDPIYFNLILDKRLIKT